MDLRAKAVFVTPVFFVLFMFFIPISPSLKSIFFVLSLGSLLLTTEYRKHLFYSYNTLWGRVAVLFFLYIVMASIWSEAPYSMRWMVVGKYCKLIYLPALAVGFIHPKTRSFSLNSYLLAICITCFISIYKAIHFVPDTDPGEVFYNHIITGFMVALAAYLALICGLKTKGWPRFVYAGLFILCSYQVLFINTGRTGYLVYIFLMILLLMQTLSFKKSIAGIILFAAAIALVYQVSPVLHGRMNDLLVEIHLLQQNDKKTSIGYRIQFHHYAHNLFSTHPWIGIGTGGFKYRFIKDNPIPSWGRDLNDPHGQYWMTLAEQGLIGMVLLLGFLGSLLISSFQLKETRPILLGVLLAFCIGSFSDTILCYSTAGYLLAVISALCFGELIEKRLAQYTATFSLGFCREHSSEKDPSLQSINPVSS